MLGLFKRQYQLLYDASTANGRCLRLTRTVRLPRCPESGQSLWLDDVRYGVGFVQDGYPMKTVYLTDHLIATTDPRADRIWEQEQVQALLAKGWMLAR